MSPGLASRIAVCAHGFRWENLSAPRQNKVRWFLADYIGSTLAGSTLPEAASGYVLAKPGPVILPGGTQGLTPDSAAVAMGTVGALLQIHDGFGGGGNHPCSSVISALWAARDRSRPLTDLLVPIAVGYEIANRIAKNSHPAQTLAGTAPTSTTGAIGSAAAVGKLRGLNVDMLANAIAIAGFNAPLAAVRGLTEHGSAVPLHGGFAARTALEAVDLAEAGLDAGVNLLEGDGDTGLIQLLRGDPQMLAPEAWNGEMIDGVYFKPIPGCRHVQPAVEAVLAILCDGPIDTARIREVRVHDYPVSLMFGMPPRSAHELYDRLMSLPWAVASCLVHGGYGYDNVAAPARDPKIEALYPRIKGIVDPEFAALYPAKLCTRIEIEFTEGPLRVGECRMEYGIPSETGFYSPRGTTTPPLDNEGMRRKFFNLACRRINQADAQSFLDQIFYSDTGPGTNRSNPSKEAS